MTRLHLLHLLPRIHARAAALVALLLLFAGVSDAMTQSARHAATRVEDALSDRAAGAAPRPVFIRNDGQWDRRARFLLRSPGLDLWITGNGVVYDINRVERIDGDAGRKGARPAGSGREGTPGIPHMAEVRIRRAPVFITFEGARSDASAIGSEQLQEYHNYFIGNDPARWATKVPLYGTVEVQGLYRGIDAVFYLDQGNPRYDLVVAAGADPASIGMKVEGARGVRVGDNGSLRIATALGTVEQRGLFAYQQIDGRREEVACRFAIGPDGHVGFRVGRYDRTRPLVIDPLVYSTYLGGSGGDQATSIAADSSGTACVVGTTTSADFPTAGALQISNGGREDVFVTKLTRSGTRVFSTYLGSSSDDDGHGIAIDASGNVYITGYTHFTGNFPLLNAAQPTFGGRFFDAFVTKLTSTGALSYSTYLGGSSDDFGNGIAVDAGGNAYIVGETTSADFPTLDAIQTRHGGDLFDMFVTRLTSSGAFSYSTYLGGSGFESGSGVAVDGSGNAYITGTTTSTNFPTLDPFQRGNAGERDLFVIKLTGSGALSYSTYFGGSSNDIGGGIAIDRRGNAYVTGTTNSVNLPTLKALQTSLAGGYDAFVIRLNSIGTLAYSTYLGGSRDETGYGVTVDGNDNVYTSGYTKSANFPVLNALQRDLSGRSDAFVTKLDGNGTLSYATYLGGNGDDYSFGIASDGKGSAYVAGITTSSDFPTANAFQTALGGSYDAFVTRLSDGPLVDILAPEAGAVWCAGSTESIRWISGGVGSVAVDISSNGGVTWSTIISGVPASNGAFSWMIPLTQTAGSYRIRVRDAGNAAVADINAISVTINRPPTAVITSSSTPTATMLGSITITSTATGAPSPTVQWQLSSDGITFTDIPGETSPTLTLSPVTMQHHRMRYRAIYTNSCGVAQTAAVLLNVTKAPAVVVLGNLSHIYDGTAKAATATTTPTGLTVDITYARNGRPVGNPTAAGSYDVTATIRDTSYQGTATGTLVIARANATIVLTDLHHIYDGTAKRAIAITTPAGLAVAIVYSRNGDPVSNPTAVGNYDVTATIYDASYEGSATGILTIDAGTAAPDVKAGAVAGATARMVPNPLGSTGALHIDGLAAGRLQATIHDIMGRAVERIEMVSTGAGTLVLPIDLGALASGFYTVHIVTARGSFTVPVRVVR